MAVDIRSELQIFEDDYGTGERDYLHVVNLAEAHVLSLATLPNQAGHDFINIGTGRGVTVKEIVKAFETVNQVMIPYQVQPRRDGDIATCYAKVDKIKNHLNWSSKLSLEDLCRDAWKVYS